MTNTTRTEPVAHNAFLATAALLFVASAAVTVAWCGSMSAMDGMAMPGGWTMSMTWMRMPGQTWIDVAASFLGMWTVMMMAMMLPSLVPMLGRYRLTQASRGETRLTRSTVVVATAYFAVWAAIGALAFVAGIAVTQVEMHVPAVSRAAPIVAGIVVIAAGALQFSAWKARHLACWDAELRSTSAWRHGADLALRCVRCCSSLTAILLVVGVMDVYAMALVTAAITIERLAPCRVCAARAVGVGMIATGLLLLYLPLQ